MWAVAPAAANVGNAFWMLPVTGGSATTNIGQSEWPYKASAVQRVGGFEFPGTGRYSPVPLGSMVAPVQQIGLETNMGMLASINAYNNSNNNNSNGNRIDLGMNLERHHHQHQQHHQQNSDSGDENPKDSQ